jgi:hypothetical protein
MRSSNLRMAALAAAIALSAFTGANAAAQMARDSSATADSVETFRTKTPIAAPAARSEAKGASRVPGAVWVPGFWDLQGDPATAPHGGWVWVPGQWIAPPVPGAQWDEAHWGWNDGWWTWLPGHWDEPQRHG